MRFFIALEVPEENRKEIALVQNRLLDLIPKASLTNNGKLHLTIAFIGEHEASIKNDLINIISQATQGIPPFELTPSYIDGFPTIHLPHTIFLGVKDDVDKLFLLQERIKDSLNKLRLEVDNRRYVPHIAIAKTESLKVDTNLENQLENLVINKEFTPIQIHAVKLFESIPSQGFHQHNTLAEIQLLEK